MSPSPSAGIGSPLGILLFWQLGYHLRAMEAIIESLSLNLPSGRVLRSWALEGGISATMTAFEVEYSDGRTETLIARKPGDWARGRCANVVDVEFRRLQALEAAGIKVPQPRFVSQDEFYVVSYIEGRPELNPGDRTDFLTKYAHQLAQIHRTDASGWDADLLTLDPGNLGPCRTEPSERFQETMVYDWLAANPRKAPNKTVLRHGDFWPGNVIWKDGEIAGVIDWEEACLGEPLADVGICRLDLLWDHGPAGMEEFTELYKAEMDLDYSDLPYWDLVASLRPMSHLAEWATSNAPLGRPDITEETMARDLIWFIDQALSKAR